MRISFLLLAWGLGCAGSRAGRIVAAHVVGSQDIVGLIADARSSAPVGSAYVVAANHGSPKGIWTAVSTADGTFEFRRMPAGEYDFQIESDGFETLASRTLALRADQDLLLEVKLKPGLPRDGQHLDLSGIVLPPVLLSGPEPGYTSAALEHRVEGRMVVKCVISEAGGVERCRIEQGLQYLDEAVVGALQARKYLPARKDGKPIEVDYTFKLDLKLPQE